MDEARMDEPTEATEPEREEAALRARIEEIRADARRARARDAERADTVEFVRQLGFDDLLED